MSLSRHVQASVSWAQVAAFRLKRQHLLERAPAEELMPVINDMTGAQAQLFSAAQISLWSRVRDLQVSHIDEALRERRLVKAACMRRTLFLVPASDLAVFVRGSTQRAEKEIRWMLGKGVPQLTLDAAIQATLSVLDAPLTRPQIAERVCRALKMQVQFVQGGGWGSRTQLASVPVGEIVCPVVYLLHLAAARGVICYGHNLGNEPTFVRADAWIPQWRDLPVDQAEEILLQRYLRAYGPATAADFALWTGITLAGARRIWARQESGLATVDVDGWQAAILQEDLDDLVHAELAHPPLRLLPYFDVFLLGHRERGHLVPKEHQADVYRSQGWIAPVVLLDGRVAGVWEYSRKNGALQVKVMAFNPLSSDIVTEIHSEAQDLSRFLGTTGLEIQID